MTKWGRSEEHFMFTNRGMRLLMIAPLAILAIVVFAFIGGEIVKLLWNWLTPPLFGWHTITFWQAFGLLALCRILFGGLGLHRSGGNWRRRMEERWGVLTPEEREKVRQRMRERLGFGPTPGGPQPTG
jgi:hypothetical protein